MILTNTLRIAYLAKMPDGTTARTETESNTVRTEILSYAVTKAIRSDKTTVRAGETVRNTVTVTNHSATKLFRIVFSIPQPDGASYVAGSVKINGVAQPNFDPITGFVLPDLNPGETVVIEYDLKADEATTTDVTHFATLNYTVNDPERGDVDYVENTDTLSLKVVSDTISVVKSVDKTFAVKGEILCYTVTITNTGNIVKNELVFKDRIPDGATFVANSVRIDGTYYSVYHPEIGFALRSLAPGEVLTVAFDVQVN